MCLLAIWKLIQLEVKTGNDDILFLTMEDFLNKTPGPLRSDRE